jgi:glycosyltransferase involved in cell wall biosynthesis
MRLSIITVNRNDAAGLEKSLRSIASQSVAPFECIVVDGASTDDSVTVAGRYGQVVSRLITEPDEGVFDAMNKGWRAARGDWLLYLNSGDELAHPEVLRTLGAQATDATDVLYGDYRDTAGKLFPTSMERGIFNHQALAYRRSLHDRFGPYLSYRGTTISDYLFFMEVAQDGRVSKVDGVLAICDRTGLSGKTGHLYQRVACDLILGRRQPRFVAAVLLLYPAYKAAKRLAHLFAR